MSDDRLRSLELVERLVSMASSSSGLWRSLGKIVLPAKELESLLNRLVDELPVDITKAREMLDEREQLTEDALARSEKIIDDAMEEAGRLLDESEITRKARDISNTIRDEADQYVLETLDTQEKQLAELIVQVKKAQSSLIEDMEKRRSREREMGS